MDPKVWGKLVTVHRRGYDDVEDLRDDGPLREAPEQAPRWDLVDTESCGGGIRFLAPVLIVWGGTATVQAIWCHDISVAWVRIPASKEQKIC